jgi:hypothetical protein
LPLSDSRSLLAHALLVGRVASSARRRLGCPFPPRSTSRPRITRFWFHENAELSRPFLRARDAAAFGAMQSSRRALTMRPACPVPDNRSTLVPAPRPTRAGTKLTSRLGERRECRESRHPASTRRLAGQWILEGWASASFIRTRMSAIRPSTERGSLQPNSSCSAAPPNGRLTANVLDAHFPHQTARPKSQGLCRPFDSGGGIRTRDLRVMRFEWCSDDECCAL